MTTQTTNKHNSKKKKISRKDKVLNTILLLFFLATVGISFLPIVFQIDSSIKQVDRLPENFTTRSTEWKTKNLFSPSYPSDSKRAFFFMSLLIISILVFIFIIISYRTKALYLPLSGLSIASCIIIINMYNAVISYDHGFTNHYDSWKYPHPSGEEHIVWDYSRESEYSNYIGAYLIIILIIAIAVMSFILSLPFIKKTYKRIKQSIEKSRENKLNRQKAFENMANYTNVPQQADQNITSDHVFCTNCGYRNLLQARFCRRCGQKIE